MMALLSHVRLKGPPNPEFRNKVNFWKKKKKIYIYILIKFLSNPTNYSLLCTHENFPNRC